MKEPTKCGENFSETFRSFKCM